MLLDNLKLFMRIVEKGSLSAAGRELNLSPATVSERLASLENYYGARLIARTTRSLSLTDEGRELMRGAKRILAETDELESRIKSGMDTISGSIQVSAPVDLGRNRIAPLLDEFMCEHDGVSVDLTLSDGYTDLVGRGIDLAVRYGDLPDSTLRVGKLADTRRIVCASPDYLKSEGTPCHPDDLQHHNCILMRFGNQLDHDWRFAIDGKEVVFPVYGNRIANDGELVRKWCRAGYGIAWKSEWDIQEDLKTGELVPLLEDYAPRPTSLQIVYPAGTVQARRIRMVMDYIAEWFSGNT